MTKILRRQIPTLGHEDFRGFDWYYLAERSRSDDALSLERHRLPNTRGGGVRHLAFQRTGPELMTAFDQITNGQVSSHISLWNSETKQQRILDESAEFTGDFYIRAFRDKDRVEILWNDRTEILLVTNSITGKIARISDIVIRKTVDGNGGEPSNTNSFKIHANGRYLVGELRDRIESGLGIWNLEDEAFRFLRLPSGTTRYDLVRDKPQLVVSIHEPNLALMVKWFLQQVRTNPSVFGMWKPASKEWCLMVTRGELSF